MKAIIAMNNKNDSIVNHFSSNFHDMYLNHLLAISKCILLITNQI